MKVLHILDSYLPQYSGYAFRSKYILNYQKKMGITPIVVVSPQNSNGFKNFEVIDDIACYRCPPPNGITKKFPYFKELYVMKTLKEYITVISKKYNINIIHSHSPILCGRPALKAAKILRLPVVYEVRALWEDAAAEHKKISSKSLRYRLSRSMETDLFKKVDAITTLCRNLKEEIESRGIQKGKIYVVNNGVDSKRFFSQPKDNSLLKRYHLEGKTILGYIGSLFSYEGLDCLIKAIKIIVNEYKKVCFLLIGDGPEIDNLKNLANTSGTSQYIIFTGKIPHSEILSYYSIIDIFVYPRRSNRLTDLTTPLKPLEAMAMAKPVIGSDVGGIKEIINNGKTGLIFQSGDLVDLANKCLTLIKNEKDRKTLGERAREYIIKHRNWEKIVGKYLDIYDGLLQKSKNKRVNIIRKEY